MKERRIFLGGTCNGDTWRDGIIPHLTAEYFNPIKEDWTPDCAQEEVNQRHNVCNMHLYVLTASQKSRLSYAEVIDSAAMADVRTLVILVGTGKHLGADTDVIMELAQLRGAEVWEVKDVNKELAERIDIWAAKPTARGELLNLVNSLDQQVGKILGPHLSPEKLETLKAGRKALISGAKALRSFDSKTSSEAVAVVMAQLKYLARDVKTAINA